ncbi:hypothetical protein B0A52_06132 [Exophiala mesophila]|uniref:DUF7514 domain-containing protein n=1 Tax=Exophiala mesophila TaxID=212818 RepID=A0A438N5M5_EXOME|nr:hypothetical protein B0A52_06132 [Exophiala mesophila]
MASHDGGPPTSANGEHGAAKYLHPGHNSSNSNDLKTRPRGTSNGSLDNFSLDPSRLQGRLPINEALQSAFNSADGGSVTSIPPELLQQITSEITANVLSQLKASSVPLATSQAAPSTSHVDASSSTAGSPPLDRATVYTPPSPHRTSEDFGQHPHSPRFPPPSESSSFRATSPLPDRQPQSPSLPPTNAPENEVPLERTSRPKGPKRLSTGGDATILEKAWGTLFNEQGEATPRFGQFLRGIAVHLIEDYEPKQSLVVTPSKMQRYYEETKLSNELYPWNIIFDDRTSSISRMFRDIEAQHHLVQDKLDERPDIPGLTPQGFQTWATLLLKAHPDQEFERLAKTALDMPISNPDDKKERFPKELSRRLLPRAPDNQVESKLQKSMSTHCNVIFRSRQNSMAESRSQSVSSNPPPAEPVSKTTLRPPADNQEASANGAPLSPALSNSGLERQRQPYSGVPTSTAPAPDPPSQQAVIDEDSEDMPTPQPIERERKPYVAAPGAGKNYDNLDKPAAASETQPQQYQPEIKLSRSTSMRDNARPNFSQHRAPPVAVHQRAPPLPMDSSDSRPHRAGSMYHRDQPRRTRSPSTNYNNGDAQYMRRSESDVSYPPPPQYPPPSTDGFDDARRYKEYEAQRERLANDRYDAARMAAYDPRERERDRDRGSRPRMQSVSDFEAPPRGSYAGYNDEDYYREKGYSGGSGSYHASPVVSTGFHPPPIHTTSANSREGLYGSYPHSTRYPPSSYKEMP